MTRINLVDPSDLADQHLMAEWREMKMIPPALRRSLKAAERNVGPGGKNLKVMMDIPAQYTLGIGHVKFFYDKLAFLKFRYKDLTDELLERGFNIGDTRPFDVYVNDLPSIFHESFVPNISEIHINVDRIVQRLNEKQNFYRHYGQLMPASFFEDRYNQFLTITKLS